MSMKRSSQLSYARLQCTIIANKRDVLYLKLLVALHQRNLLSELLPEDWLAL